MADLAEQSAKLAIDKMGVSEELAIQFGNDLADFFADHWNGQSIYINSDAKYQLSKRDMEIFARFGRGNAHELAKEFNISYVRIYQIYKRCLVVARRRSQPALFEDNLGSGSLPK